ncbi:MAG: protoporphyrinogen/coproporphyrinogen oxidase [Thermocrispum sp.]
MAGEVIVVGAGIAGLATAYRLRSAGIDAVVYESSGVVGGRMATERRDGFVVDTGADGLLPGYRNTTTLLRALGLRTEPVSLTAPTAGVWRDGRVHIAPQSLAGLATFSAISTRTRAKSARIVGAMCCSGHYDGIDVAAFARRIGGDELLDYVLEPCVRGLFGWDPGRSSAGVLLRFLASCYGGLRLRTYRSGMDRLARELARQVPVRLNTRVRTVRGERSHAVVGVDGQGERRVAACVVAVPAPAAVDIVDDTFHSFVRASEYTAMTCVDAFLGRPIGRPEAYGVMFPTRDESVLAWMAFESAKPGRVPPGRELVRLTTIEPLGSAGSADPAVVIEHADRYFPGLAAAVDKVTVTRFQHALPRFAPTAQVMRESFRSRSPSAVEFAGDWLCAPCSEGAVRSSRIAARRVRAWFAQHR